MQSRIGLPVPFEPWSARAVAVLALSMVACGSDGNPSSRKAGAGGTQITTGGIAGSAGGAGASGNASSRGGIGSDGMAGETGGAIAAGGGVGTGVGGVGASSGGALSSGGAPSSGGAGNAGAPALTDVDLTLGGLNQDIPAPSKDCLAVTRVPRVACFSARGEWGGEQIDVSCDENVGPSSAGTQPPDPFVGCDAKLPSGDDIELIVRLAGALIGPIPKAFTFSVPPDSDAHTRLDLSEVTKGYITHIGETFTLAATYDETVKIAGLADAEPGIRSGTQSEIIKGTFAVTLSPKARCPAGTAFECLPIRLRGTFHGRTIVKL